MSAAGYNRGSALLSRQLDAEATPHELRILRDLSACAAAHDGAVPFTETIVRFGPGPGEVALMNRARGGWGQRAVVYRSLWTLARHWRLVFLGFGADEHSRFVRVAPLPRKAGSQ